MKSVLIKRTNTEVVINGYVINNIIRDFPHTHHKTDPIFIHISLIPYIDRIHASLNNSNVMLE